MKTISVIVASQVNIIVQPLDGDAFNANPEHTYLEAQEMANLYQKPVVLLPFKAQDRKTFHPAK